LNILVSDLRFSRTYRAQIPYLNGAAVAIYHKPYQLLIADDDRGFRAALKHALDPYFETVEASSGEEAIQVVEYRRIDIAILDMHMEVLTGLDTLRIVKTIKAVLPCIILTADTSDQLRRDAADADAFSVLTKPVSKFDLISTVSSAIEEVYDDPDVFPR
jgi:CheY-like chemotaxis protein